MTIPLVVMVKPEIVFILFVVRVTGLLRYKGMLVDAIPPAFVSPIKLPPPEMSSIDKFFNPYVSSIVNEALLRTYVKYEIEDIIIYFYLKQQCPKQLIP